MSYSSFSTKLQQLRNNMGWSQGELADRLKVATSTVSMYERGKREPNIVTINELASIFNVTVDELMGEKDAPNSEPCKESTNDEHSFGYMIKRSRGNGKKETVELWFRGSQPVLSVNGTALEFSLTYSDLLPEDKIAVCRAMLDRAKDELMRGIRWGEW